MHCRRPSRKTFSLSVGKKESDREGEEEEEKKRGVCVNCFEESLRASSGHFTTRELSSRLHAHTFFLSSAAFFFFFRRLFGFIPPQKHGEDRGNEGQTEEEEGAHVGRGCSDGKITNLLCLCVLFSSLSGLYFYVFMRHERPDKAPVSVKPLRLGLSLSALLCSSLTHTHAFLTLVGLLNPCLRRNTFYPYRTRVMFWIRT